jgi:hypothetical protein
VINALGSFVTHFEPHGNEVRWDDKHVVFLGDADLHVLRRWLQHGRYIVELHDRDPKDLPDGVVCPHGEARFSFAQLLPDNSMAQHFKSVRLRGDVLPYRGNIKVRFNKTKSGGIPVEDLLTGDTAAILKNFTSSNERREFTPDYILAGTCIVIQVDMLEPLPPAKDMRKDSEDEVLANWAASEVVVQDALVERPGNAPETRPVFEVVSNPDGTAFRARAQPGGPEDERGPWRLTSDLAVDDAVAKSMDANAELEENASEPLNLRYERFGRLILVLHYNETQHVKQLLKVVREVNELAFGLEPGSRELQTRQLSDEEKADVNKDMLTGFIVLDGSIRIAVVEGLRGGALDRLAASLPRDKANDERIKFLYNPNIGFPTRAFVDFAQPLAMKQVRLRQRLDLLAQQFKIYDPAIPALIEGSAKAVLSLVKMRTAIRMHRVTMSDFPMPTWIEKLENQYGDFITDEELEGGVAPDSERKGGVDYGDAYEDGSGDEDAGDGTLARKPGADFMQRYETRRKVAIDNETEGWAHTTMERSKSMPNFIHKNLTKVHQVSLENKRNQVDKYPSAASVREALQGHDVFIYSGQKLNSAELQKAQMRKDYLAQQETKMWSYSAVYNNNSFPLVEEGTPSLVLREEYVQHPNVSAPSGSGPKNGKVLERYPEALGAKFPEGARGRFRPWLYPTILDGKERLPARDVGHARPDELHEQWQENEWRIWPGRERGKPLAEGVEGVTSRLTGNPVEDANQPWPRPFDPSKVYNGKTATGVHVPNDPFGDQAMYTSPLQQVTPLEVEQTMLQMTKREQRADLEGLKELETHGGRHVETSQPIHKGRLGTKDIHVHLTHRHVVQSTDKCEPILKPDRKVADHKVKSATLVRNKTAERIDFAPLEKPHTVKRPAKLGNRPEDSRKPHLGGTKKGTTVKKYPVSIHYQEEFHEDGPSTVIQARMRANDSDPPYNVRHDTYLPRSQEYGTKRGYLASDGAGTALGAAPWRHTSRPTTTLERFSLTGRPESFQPNQVDPETYAGRSKDMERYRHPATQITRTMDQDAYEVKRMVWREEYLSKNASRASLTPLDHTMKNNTQKFRSSSTARVKLSM